ncbi:hypothetical protein E2C01_062791 [Portunus trituberculatus]|uniref:Uncharacterized protein n=1 Tax=Portunus trituberculatus TaxID=210409 RepID=A0A5B7HFV1_PORTR|nr:hypothetical protein [Portunus trituberculatus]
MPVTHSVGLFKGCTTTTNHITTTLCPQSELETYFGYHSCQHYYCCCPQFPQHYYLFL